MSVGTCPQQAGSKESQWIILEDVNIEYLLDVFMSVDMNSIDVWAACGIFMRDLHSHKSRVVRLGPKIEGLPDSHPVKLWCLVELSHTFGSVGQREEEKRLLGHILRLHQEQGDEHGIVHTLEELADSNEALRLYEEAIVNLKEALGIYEQLGDKVGQADTLQHLALLFVEVKQVNAAEEAASHAINLLPNEPGDSTHCEHHHILAHICESRGESEEAISHFEKALGIPSSAEKQMKNLYCFSRLLLDEEWLCYAQACLNQIKSCDTYDPHPPSGAEIRQAYILFVQGRFEEAKFQLLHIVGENEKVGGSPKSIEECKVLLQVIEVGTNGSVTSVSHQ